MRRISPATVCRARTTSARRLPLSRPLCASSIACFPRSGPFSARHQSSDAATPSQTSSTADNVEEHFIDDEPSAPSTPDDFADQVISLTEPARIEQPLPDELQSLYHHLRISFLPHNQPCTSNQPPAVPPQLNGGWMPIRLEDEDDASSPTMPESVLALVNPFEGGRWYTEGAVARVAAELEADVLKFDLALGLGVNGPSSPLGRSGPSAPSLPSSPLMQERASSPAFSPSETENMDEGDDEHDMGKNSAIIMSPMNLQSAFPRPAVPDAPTAFKEAWVSFFESWINRGEQERPRVILLESIESMSSTFDEWWPSLVEAVRRRRREEVSEDGQESTYKLRRPTTIVFSSSPSMLLSHTSAVKDENDATASQVAPLVQAIADRFGGAIETKVENGESSPVWWGSEELDEAGRKDRNGKRLAALLDEARGPSSLMPTLGPRPKSAGPRHPLLDMIMGNRSQQDETKQPEGLIWKTLPIIPSERDLALEMLERIRTRSLISAALLGKAIHDLGGHLLDPVSAIHRVKVEPTKPGAKRATRYYRINDPTDQNLSKLARGENYRISRDGWHNLVHSWADLRQTAATVLGEQLAKGEESVTWLNVLATSETEKSSRDKLSERIRGYLPKTRTPRHSSRVSPVPEPPVDSVVTMVKKAKDLTAHEKRLLGSIVDPSKLASTSFDDVHLPFKTIDAIRTIISLPLLFPEAFKGGVLKDHATTGALLFGPPGTGKTLLARAVAKESGARMLAIQPSDVNDKYFGEGEKLVKAVFSLARRLSPCVVFLDEVDALFGARSARGGGMGSKAHDQLLTEFMQEMDGLSSAEVNKDKRIVVIGATNRPFDLDDAVLRRLPRRLLVDLPGPEDRKAILKILLKDEELGSDVDIEHLSKETDGFSGSDLKHLCVSAALAAVKDGVRIPWKQLSELGSTQTPPPEPTSHSSPPPSPNVIVEESSPDIIVPQAVLETDARAQLPVEGNAVDAPASPNAATGADVEQTTATGVDAHQTGAGATGTATDESDVTEAPSEQKVAPRVVSKKHFDIALTEIRPSSTEEGSLPELRRWAEQFGEGGSQKGRKKGFGKGFGFGDPAVSSDRDKGYGKVVQD